MRYFHLFFLFAGVVVSCVPPGSWRTADRSSAGVAPSPESHPEAVVQGYAARAWSWCGIFGVHTWIAAKEKNAPHDTVYQLVGWRLRRGESAVVVEPDVPDRKWYGKTPEILFDLRGEAAETVLPHLARRSAKLSPSPAL